jgi:tetratricopeptide (TPR) repeat protein
VFLRALRDRVKPLKPRVDDSYEPKTHILEGEFAGTRWKESMEHPSGLAFCALIVLSTFACAQEQLPPTASLQGHVLDKAGAAVANVFVELKRIAGDHQNAEASASLTEKIANTRTDSGGAYRFSGLTPGSYDLCAEITTGGQEAHTHLELARPETKTVDLVLRPSLPRSPAQAAGAPQTACNSVPAAKLPDFFDEPQFVVAGVRQASNSGGHGSDVELRTSEALVRATGSLGAGSSGAGSSDAGSSSSNASGNEAGVSAENIRRERAKIEAQIQSNNNVAGEPARQQQAERFHQLAQLDERAGNPLEAVRTYQRAAELNPDEQNLFDWASELLTHRALQPATEIFTQGTQRFPQSTRMRIGLAVAWYARGSYERALHDLANASDIEPSDPSPYLFMGRMQSAETPPSDEILDRLARFQQLAPQNALANYYYAVGLWKRKRTAGTLDDASLAQIEALLQKAVQLDPGNGAAFLQLGIVNEQKGNEPSAISAYQKAIDATPDLEEAHYRLALAYRRTGRPEEAQKEMSLHAELAKKSQDQAERQRREIQEFVVSLGKSQDSPQR